MVKSVGEEKHHLELWESQLDIKYYYMNKSSVYANMCVYMCECVRYKDYLIYDF